MSSNCATANVPAMNFQGHYFEGRGMKQKVNAPIQKIHKLHWTTNFKNFFVSVMNMLLIYLFESMKLEMGH